MKNRYFNKLRKHFNSLVFFFITSLFTASHAQPTITLTPIITTGLRFPMQVLHAGDGSGRIFVIERAGVIKVFQGSSSTPTLSTFLNLNVPAVKVGTIGEGGLLSLAFHPDYGKVGKANSGVFFAYYTNTRAASGDLVIEKYKIADPASNQATVVFQKVILKIPHRSASNHNGGMMHFGKDGYLYLSVGDGGGAGDQNNNAQRIAPANAADSSYFLGKMLRIDVNTPSAGRDYSIPPTNQFGNEIYDYGLRNPFRWNFDRLTGDMWIGDVGQNNWEEIDFRAASASPGVDYGWNCFEGGQTYPGTGPNCGVISNFDPVYYYDGQSVIGGTVYRGTRYVDLIGYYIGTDYYSGNFHLVKRNESNTAWVTTVAPKPLTGTTPATVSNITNIGEAENGELYVTSLSGNSIYHVEASGPLPVKLVEFEGIKTQEGTRLFWETSAEQNFDHFEVEYGADLSSFTTIGRQLTANIMTGRRYQFSHSVNFSGNAYYRLKMVDTDSSFEYSRVIVVKSDNLDGVFVRPSLINTGFLSLVVDAGYQSIELISTTGKLIQRLDIAGRTGHMEVPVSGTNAGIYLVRLIGKDNVKQQKIVIVD